ncbi:MAG: type II toxin-antitoxin system VapC family toxin [Aliidongia sp.]
MSRDVLDSSAVLAAFYGEAGADSIDDLLRGAVISTVNVAEIISKLVERGMSAAMARSALIDTGIEIVPFDLAQAELAGDLRQKTRPQGLSLGDRACLALAKQINGRAVTADRAWTAVEDLGIEILLFRGAR